MRNLKLNLNKAFIAILLLSILLPVNSYSGSRHCGKTISTSPDSLNIKTILSDSIVNKREQKIEISSLLDTTKFNLLFFFRADDKRVPVTFYQDILDKIESDTKYKNVNCIGIFLHGNKREAVNFISRNPTKFELYYTPNMEKQENWGLQYTPEVIVIDPKKEAFIFDIANKIIPKKLFLKKLIDFIENKGSGYKSE